MKKKTIRQGKSSVFTTKLRSGDTVMVIAGGNKNKGKVLKGQIAKIRNFVPDKKRVIVEGLNMVTRHQKARTSQETSGKIKKEGSVHISNVMYYSEDLKKPVRISSKKLDDGRKVRGFINPENKEFVQIDTK